VPSVQLFANLPLIKKKRKGGDLLEEVELSRFIWSAKQ
jgi:hypothetical protein